MGTAERVAYTLAQGARVAWFSAHYVAAWRMAGPIETPPEWDTRAPGEVPGWPKLVRRMGELFRDDLKNIEAGHYAMPGWGRSPADMLSLSRRFFRDFRLVDRRRLEGINDEPLAPERRGKFPRYYLQNFHYQSGGYLTPESAKLYDYQVETLFNGTADAMRRQALVPLREAIAGRDQRGLRLLDVACGTARFLRFVKENYPRLRVTALDLSPDYLNEARRLLRPWRDTRFVEGNAEAMPVEDESQDIVTAIYLFHELPKKARHAAAREIARVLKPGGRFIFVDSFQRGDDPEFESLLEFFPHTLYEPYFEGYTQEDLGLLFGAAGLHPVGTMPAFLSKIAVFEKPAG